ncbi:MAG: peptide deformylase [Patescibacteria group bacterium]|jgi:peptide deformylase|nr:peptide deformylase [Patescibacteria group bacterium]
MTKVYPLTLYPDKILRQSNRTIKLEELPTKEFAQLLLDMETTMKAEDGVGLAAPQIGKNIKLTVINTADGTLALINPKITRKSLKKEEMEEGCLSLPGIFGRVKRSYKIKVTALDKNGRKVKFKASGYFARVIQHEVDHLNGILFIDRTKDIVEGQDKLAELRNKLANG